MKVITFGTFDLFHVGHVNILNRASELGNELIVGVSSDKLNFKKKQRYPIYNQNDRMKIINNLKCVSHVFLEESLEKKVEYIKEFGCDILVMGDDWEGKFDDMPCKVLYLPRTEHISSTDIIQNIRNN